MWYDFRSMNNCYYDSFIFDLDGTLVDSIQDIADAVNYAFDKFKLPTRPLSEFPSYLGDGSYNLIKRALKDIQLTEEGFNQVFNTYYDYYMCHFLVKTKAYDFMLEALEHAKSLGIKLFVYSNKPADIAEEVVYHCFPKDLFNKVVGIPLKAPVKPAPDVFLKATASFDIDYSRAAYFGDSGTDILTGINLNIEDIYSVLWGYKTEEFLRHFKIAPKGFLHSPKEIEAIASRTCDKK